MNSERNKHRDEAGWKTRLKKKINKEGKLFQSWMKEQGEGMSATSISGGNTIFMKRQLRRLTGW